MGFRWKKRASALCALLLSVCLAVPAAAANNTGSVTVDFKAAGTAFRLYRVADVGRNLFYTPTAEFERYNVQLNGLDSAGWRGAARLLETYAKRDGISPLQTGEMDADGKLVFSGLDVGLYLLAGDAKTVGSVTYTPEAALVLIADAGDAEMDVTVQPKSEQTHKPDRPDRPDEPDEPDEPDNPNVPDQPDVPDGESTTRRVRKLWADGGRAERPASITAQLLKDGAIYAEVTLNQENGWSYQWTGLETGADWQVLEAETPAGYLLSADQDGETIILTNTYETEVPTTPTTPDGGEKLPQTGTLWWAVPPLAIGGALLWLIGAVRARRQEDADGEE